MSTTEALHASNFENVSEVGCEMQRQRSVDRIQTVILNLELLIARRLPKKFLQRQVKRAKGISDFALADQIGVRERYCELIVLVPHSGAEEKWTALLEFEQKAGKVPRSFVIQALFAKPARRNVAVVIKNGEGVTLLKHSRPLIGRTGDGKDVGVAAAGWIRRCWLKTRAHISLCHSWA
jgi:hypothetical protein